ncbi:hypothetical protein, partial [Vibrio parahaemolyticus]|uniref:hypothetical protein n=1 Tax=Vibrio parahaemolyticus TaxID=670 RepID=UPI003211A971
NGAFRSLHVTFLPITDRVSWSDPPAASSPILSTVSLLTIAWTTLVNAFELSCSTLRAVLHFCSTACLY